MSKPIQIFVSEEQDALRVGVRPKSDQPPTEVSLPINDALKFFSQFAFSLKRLGERLSPASKGGFSLLAAARSSRVQAEIDGAISLELASDYLPTTRFQITDKQARAIAEELLKQCEVPQSSRKLTRN